MALARYWRDARLEANMRSNSGKDEARNNMHDQMVIERDRKPQAEKAKHFGRAGTTEMGSRARKSGQDGEDEGR